MGWQEAVGRQEVVKVDVETLFVRVLHRVEPMTFVGARGENLVPLLVEEAEAISWLVNDPGAMALRMVYFGMSSRLLTMDGLYRTKLEIRSLVA